MQIFSDKTSGDSTDENVYVTFEINREIYGINVLTVQEIIGMIHITPVPCSLNYLKGVINLRGRVVPVFDMRIMFRLPEKEYDSATVIIIIETNEKPVGLIVDAVLDVVDIPVELSHEYSHSDGKFKSDYISSIANYNDDLILILNIESLVDESAFENIPEPVGES